jgi:RNA polymerase sigma-70 factor (ECF subfamily)
MGVPALAREQIPPEGAVGLRLLRQVAPDERLSGFDPESLAWVRALHSEGPARDQAIARLHALLLRAARFEVSRRRGTLQHVSAHELDDIAVQSADDALVAILAKLSGFRGDSRFTTWAYKFALLEAGVKLRRRPWQEREVRLEPEDWPQLRDSRGGPHADAEQRELIGAIRDAIDGELTPHQRHVLLTVAVAGVPIDVLAERLDTTRGALYKTIHDARRKLRGALEASGHSLREALGEEDRP